jgi:hypothetical protein
MAGTGGNNDPVRWLDFGQTAANLSGDGKSFRRGKSFLKSGSAAPIASRFNCRPVEPPTRRRWRNQLMIYSDVP